MLQHLQNTIPSLVYEQIMVLINPSVTILNRVHLHKIEGKENLRLNHFLQKVFTMLFSHLYPLISSLYLRQYYSPQYNYKFMNLNRRWSTTVWLANYLAKKIFFFFFSFSFCSGHMIRSRCHIRSIKENSFILVHRTSLNI